MVDEAVRATAMKDSSLVQRSVAWARCDALRKKAEGNHAFWRLVYLLCDSVHQRFEVVSAPGDRRTAGNVIVIELPVLKYNVDIAIPALGIVIEHDEQNNHSSEAMRAKDAARAAEISSLGWAVLSVHHLDWVFDRDPRARLARLLSANIRGPVSAGIPEPLESHPCACGCGELVAARRKYIRHHHLSAELAAKAGRASWRKGRT